MDNKSIPMYWWEGSTNFSNTFSRLCRLKPAFVKNFGDQLSPFIISLLTDGAVTHAKNKGKLLALGSVFFGLQDQDHVWGTGLLNSKHIYFPKLRQHVTYHAVRGPETRHLLKKNNIDCPEIYGDPALLLPTLIKNDLEKKYKIGIAPHFYHYDFIVSQMKPSADICIIDVEKPLNQVTQAILRCELILSSSLHGLMVAEAYGIPALLITLNQPLHGDMFKFSDYFHATDRSLFHQPFDPNKLIQLANLAAIQPKPRLNLQPLLNAFPYKIKSKPLLNWSEITIKSYPASLLPPWIRRPKAVD